MNNAESRQLLAYYKTMLVIRLFEQRLAALFTQGRIHGTTHSCTGQEAAAVGACAAIRTEDYVVSNHRGHGHFIAKTGSPGRLMAEICGRATGASGGRGGSQHVADFSKGFLCSNGITGGGLPIATGAALAIKLKKLDRVVLCFFGDGAATQGTFHESLNMAAIWKLPIIFFCENNLYAMSTPFRDNFPVTKISDRAPAYAMPSAVVDGNNVLDVHDTVRKAAQQARAGGGPFFVEAVTYRHSGHSKSDNCEYRPDDEEAQWLAKDPIARLRKMLETLAPAAEIERAERDARIEIDEAEKFALASPEPDPDGLDEASFA